MDHLETLFAVVELGTMGKAATRLRITQSAVSKRIKSLEAQYGTAVIESQGRNVRLTEAGARLLFRVRPLWTELKACLVHADEKGPKTLVLGISESLMASIAPLALKEVLSEMPEIQLEIHTHRSPVAVEHVRSGDYTLALCAETFAAKDLESLSILREPMVILPSQLSRLRLRKGVEVPVLTIESNSATWSDLSGRISKFDKEAKIRLSVSQTLESFTAVAQMAKAGFGHGLVPIGIAMSMGLKRSIVPLPAPGLYRQISLVGRRSILNQKTIQDFAIRLQAVLSEMISSE